MPDCPVPQLPLGLCFCSMGEGSNCLSDSLPPNRRRFLGLLLLLVVVVLLYLLAVNRCSLTLSLPERFSLSSSAEVGFSSLFLLSCKERIIVSVQPLSCGLLPGKQRKQDLTFLWLFCIVIIFTRPGIVGIDWAQLAPCPELERNRDLREEGCGELADVTVSAVLFFISLSFCSFLEAWMLFSKKFSSV